MIVEDDSIIANVLKEHLTQWDYHVDVVTDFRGILEQFLSADPHVILMDIGLPYFNGYHWCSEIRKISKVPLIFISSASDAMNIVMAMNMGGDDFISKPFVLSVVIAKIQALLRRTYAYHGQVFVLEYNGVILNLTEATLAYKNEKLELTKNEFKIMQLLMEQPQKIIGRDVIITKLWESDSFIDDNTLTVNMTRLRKKLEDLQLESFIHTKKGIGYYI